MLLSLSPAGGKGRLCRSIVIAGEKGKKGKGKRGQTTVYERNYQ